MKPLGHLKGWRQYLATLAIAAALISAPLASGATGPIAGTLLKAVIVAVIGTQLLTARKLGRWWWPAAIVTLFGLTQVAALPLSVCGIIAPFSAALWQSTGGYLAEGQAAISVDPHATGRAARELGVLVALVAVVARGLIAEAATRAILIAISAAGVVTLGLGLCVRVTRTKGSWLLDYADFIGPIDWWLTPLKRPEQASGFGYLFWTEAVGQRFAGYEWAIGDGFGAYVVSNHFAFAIYLTIPTLFSLLLAQPIRSWLSWWRSAIVVGLTGGSVATIGLLAGSRAGAMSAAVSMLTFWAITETRPRLRPIAVASCTLYAATMMAFLVLFYGNLGAVVDWAPASAQAALRPMFADVRIATTATAFEIFGKSWFMGAGLGTFGELNRMASPERAAVQWFTHNDYAQFLAEAGLVGGAGLLSSISVMFWQFVAFLRNADPQQRLMYAGPWAGLAGLAVHSAFDWNMHVPANAFFAAVLIGIVLGPRYGPVKNDPPVPVGRGFPITQIIAKALLILLAVVCLGLSVRDTATDLAARGLRDALTSVRKAKREKKETDYHPLEAAVAHAERSAPFDPRNPELAQTIGQSKLVLAGEPQEIDQANALVEQSAVWFERARRNKATNHGLPATIVSGSGPLNQ